MNPVAIDDLPDELISSSYKSPASEKKVNSFVLPEDLPDELKQPTTVAQNNFVPEDDLPEPYKIPEEFRHVSLDEIVRSKPEELIKKYITDKEKPPTERPVQTFPIEESSRITEKKQPVNMLGEIIRPFKAVGATAMQTFAEAGSGIAHTLLGLQNIAQKYIPGFASISKEGGFEQAAKAADEAVNYWQQKAKDANANIIDKVIGGTIGSAPAVVEFIAGGPAWYGLQGAVEAERRGDNILMGALSGAAKRLLLGKIFQSMNELKIPERALTTGTIFAAQTASEGGTPEQIGESFGVGLLTAGLSTDKGTYGLKDIFREATGKLDGSIRTRFEYLKQHYESQGMTPEQAEVKAFNEISDTPGGAATISKIAQEIADRFSKNMEVQRINKAQERVSSLRQAEEEAVTREPVVSPAEEIAPFEPSKIETKAKTERIVEPKPVPEYDIPETAKETEQSQISAPKEIELPKPIPPEGKINAITREEAGELLAKGDESVLPHIAEGIQEHGTLKMQDAIRNQIMEEIAKAPKEERPIIAENYKRLQPTIDKILNGELTVEDLPTEGIEIPDHIRRALQEVRKVPESVAIKTKQLTKDTLNEGLSSGLIKPTEPIRLTTVDELRDIIKGKRLTEGKDFEDRTGISAQLVEGNKPIVAYGDNDKISAAIIFPEDSALGKGGQPNEVKINPDIPVEKLRFVIDGYKEIMTFDDLRNIIEKEAKPEISPLPEKQTVESEIPELEPVAEQQTEITIPHLKFLKSFLAYTEGPAKVYGEEGQVVGRLKSDRPKEIQDLARKYRFSYLTIQDILNRAIEGKPLSSKADAIPKRQEFLRELIDRTKDIYEMVGKKEISLDEIKPGDKFIKDGEEYRHVGFDEDGNAIIKDGMTYIVDPFKEAPKIKVDEFIPAESGQILKTQEIQETKQKPVQEDMLGPTKTGLEGPLTAKETGITPLEQAAEDAKIRQARAEAEKAQQQLPQSGEQTGSQKLYSGIPVDEIIKQGSEIAEKVINNPNVKAMADVVGKDVLDGLRFIKGKKGIVGKLLSIPFRVAQRHPEFRPVYEAISNSWHKANEITNDVSSVFTQEVREKIRKSEKVSKALFSAQERQGIVFKLTPEGLLQTGRKTRQQIDNYLKIAEKIPANGDIAKRVSEYFDKNIVELLEDIEWKFGIKHKRVEKVGREALGRAYPDLSLIKTQIGTELSVWAHEIGHILDKKFNLWDKIVESDILTRPKIKKQLQALTDLYIEGMEGVPKTVKKAIRKKPEKMARILETYIYAPERFKEVAPDVYERWERLIEDIPELGMLQDVKRGIALVKRDVYTSGSFGNVLRDMVNSGEISVEEALDYLSVRKDLNEQFRTIADAKTDKVERVLTQGLEYTNDELRRMGLSQQEIESYKRARQTIEKGTELFINKLKERFKYNEEDELNKAIMDVQLDESVRKIGAYMPLMRFGDYWLEYISADGVRHVSSYDSKFARSKAKIKLEKEGAENITEIDMKDERALKRLYPYLSIKQLDSLLEKAEISKNERGIKELRDILKERIGNAALIRREWVPGYERTGDHAVRTIEHYLDNNIKGYVRAKAINDADNALKKIDNTSIKQYAQRYIDTFNLSVNDASIFQGMRQIASLWYLAGRPSYVFQNIASTFRTYNRISKDAGIFAGGKVWIAAHDMTARYIANRTAALAGKEFNAGLSKDYLDAMEQLRKEGIISANFVDEMIAVHKGVITKGKGKIAKDTFLNFANALAAAMDKYTREHAATAGYLVAKQKGLPLKDTLALMKDYIADTQTIYSPYNQPVWVRELDTKLKGGAKSLYMFQQFSWDWIQQMAGYLRGSLSGNQKAANLKGLMTSAAFFGAFTGIKGLPLAMFLAGIYALATGDDIFEKARKIIGDKEISDVAIYGLLSKYTGVDFSGLLGLGMWPYNINPQAIVEGDIPFDTAVTGLGGRIKRGITLQQRGNLQRAIAEFMPNVVRDYMLAKTWEEEGKVRTLSGKPLMEAGKPLEPTPTDIRIKRLGFTPLRISKAYEEKQAESTFRKSMEDRNKIYRDRIMEALLKNDTEELQRIRDEIQRHNQKYIGQPEKQIKIGEIGLRQPPLQGRRRLSEIIELYKED